MYNAIEGVNEMGRRRNVEIEKEILDLRRQGYTHREIAGKTGASEEKIRTTLKAHGLGGVSEKGLAIVETQGQRYRALYQKTSDVVCTAVYEWSDGLYEYVKGYTNCDSVIVIRCTNCGEETNQSFVSIRKGRGAHRCRRCEELKKEKARQERAEEKRREAEAKKRAKEEAIAARVAARTHACPECGSITAKRLYCSEQCRRRSCDRKKEIARRKKIQDVFVDRISLKLLYEKENGVCYLCGKPCDWNDKEEREAAIVCGNTYPSIDHVMPLAHGGKHEWSNVRLAHRLCNSVKSDSIAPYA